MVTSAYLLIYGRNFPRKVKTSINNYTRAYFLSSMKYLTSIFLMDY